MLLLSKLDKPGDEPNMYVNSKMSQQESVKNNQLSLLRTGKCVRAVPHLLETLRTGKCARAVPHLVETNCSNDNT